jgi:hypothetical protein
MPKVETLCGYELADVRRTLRDAIDKRDYRAAHRWTAELVATPGAVGSLWSSYWLAWAAAQGAGSPSPTIPILLRQSWTTITELVQSHSAELNGKPEFWKTFRNDPAVRALAAEMTVRLLAQARQTPVVWPSKEIILYDVSMMRDAPVPAAVDSPVVREVWQRGDESMELRMMAGRWIDALQKGDIRAALSAVAWTLLPTAQQSLQTPLKVVERGPATLTAKQRASPIWFWLAMGRALIMSRGSTIHRGWNTMHAAIAEAFRLHFARWTAVDRMRILLAWILQLRATYLPQPDSLWSAPATQQHAAEIDLPYKEIAGELADPARVVIQHEKAPTPTMTAKDEKKVQAARMESQLMEADAQIMKMMGLEDEI